MLLSRRPTLATRESNSSKTCHKMKSQSCLRHCMEMLGTCTWIQASSNKSSRHLKRHSKVNSNTSWSFSKGQPRLHLLLTNPSNVKGATVVSKARLRQPQNSLSRLFTESAVARHKNKSLRCGNRKTTVRQT